MIGTYLSLSLFLGSLLRRVEEKHDTSNQTSTHGSFDLGFLSSGCWGRLSDLGGLDLLNGGGCSNGLRGRHYEGLKNVSCRKRSQINATEKRVESL